MSTILSEIASLKDAPKFVSFRYTSKESGEVSNVVVALNCDLEQMYRDDLKTLQGLAPMLEGVNKIAAEELIASMTESLTKGLGNNSRYTKPDTYVHVQGLPGVKVHKQDGTMYVTGLSHSKNVIIPGTYKSVNSSAKTIAKNKLRKTLAHSKFREYVLPNIRGVVQKDDTLELAE